MSTYINPQTGEPLAEESVAEETVTTDQEDAVDASALENNVGDDDHAIEFYHKTTTRMPDEPVEQVGPASPYEAAEPFVPRTPDPSEWPMRERHYWLSNQEKIYRMLLPAITAALAIIMVVVYIGVNVLLAVVKFLTGLMTGSVAVTADAASLKSITCIFHSGHNCKVAGNFIFLTVEKYVNHITHCNQSFLKSIFVG